MPTFPSLPKPLVGTFQEVPANNTLRSTMERGPAKVRKATTANVYNIAFTVMLSTAQVATLQTFFTGDADYGATSFDFTHPRTGATVTARFTQPPEYYDINGLYYRVNINMEILP